MTIRLIYFFNFFLWASQARAEELYHRIRTACAADIRQYDVAIIPVRSKRFRQASTCRPLSCVLR